jgi:hypothetical protein
MLLFDVTIPSTVPQRSEIPEELMNYPLQKENSGFNVQSRVRRGILQN